MIIRRQRKNKQGLIPLNILASIEFWTLGIFCLWIVVQHIVLGILNLKRRNLLWANHDFTVLYFFPFNCICIWWSASEWGLGLFCRLSIWHFSFSFLYLYI